MRRDDETKPARPRPARRWTKALRWIARILLAAVLLLAAGHMMAPSYGGVMQTVWIRWSYLLLIGSGLIWLCILLPLQITQARLLKPLPADSEVPERYRTLALRWMVAGSIATILPLPAIYLMVAKPI